MEHISGATLLNPRTGKPAGEYNEWFVDTDTFIAQALEDRSHRSGYSGQSQILADLTRSRETGRWGPTNSLNTWDETLRAEIQDATAIATSTTETILVPDVVLPARYLMATGRTLRANIWGRYGTTATPTMTVRVRVGGVAGVVVMASAAYTMASGVTTVPFWIHTQTTVRTEGSSGTIFGMGIMLFSTAAPNTQAPQFLPSTAPAVSSAIDFTAQQNYSITAQWGTSSASNTIQAHMYTLESQN